MTNNTDSDTSGKSQQILDALQTLMDKQGAFGDDFPGIPFVHSEKEFGITMSRPNGGLYAINHLIDSLAASNYFDGAREPATDLDTMVYTFGLGKTKIYDGAIARRTENGMSLTINTDRSANETLAAITSGIMTAQARLDRRAAERKSYAEMVRREFDKENAEPVFDGDTDSGFVKTYLKAKMDTQFSGSPETEAYGPLPAKPYLRDIFSDYGIDDTRPRFEVEFIHTEENYRSFNDYRNDTLKKIFTAPLAVDVIQGQGRDNTIEIEVRGNPSRLARDIFQNDFEFANDVASSMGLRVDFADKARLGFKPSSSRKIESAPGFGSGPT